MGAVAWRKLGLGVVSALVVLTLGGASQAGAQGSGLQLPDVTQTPVVDDVVDSVEANTGVDLPLGQEPTPAPPSAPPSSPSGGSGGSAPATPAPAASAPGSAPAAPASPSGTNAPASSAPAASSGTPGAGGGDSAGANGDGSGDPRQRDERSAEPNRDNGADEKATDDSSQSPIANFFGEIEELPWTVFAAILALALVGLAMAGRSAALTLRGRRLSAQRRELREDVGALQAALLPEIPDRIGDVALSVAYQPSDGPAAGGDFYDVVGLRDDRIAIVIGDVSGHGREALTVTALAHYTVRAYLEAGLEPREALRLSEVALGGKLGENFVTALAATYDPARSTLTFASAGHPAPAIVGAGDPGEIDLLTPPPIGIGPATGYRQTTVSIEPGARICLFTDGVVEARTAPGRLLERDGVLAMLDDLGPRGDAADVLERLAVETRVADDATVCFVCPLDAHGDGRVVEELDLASLDGLGERLESFLEACGLDAEQLRLALAEVRRHDGADPPARLRVTRATWGVEWQVIDPPATGGDPLRPPMVRGATPTT